MQNLIMSFRSESLMLNADTFGQFAGKAAVRPMTLRGTVYKTVILLVVAAASAAGAWFYVIGRPSDWAVYAGAWMEWAFLAIVGALWVALATTEHQRIAWITGPFVAVLEGCGLGILSAVCDAMHPGSFLPGVLVSFASLLSLLVLYRVSGFQVPSRIWLGASAALMASALLGGVVLGLQILRIHTLDFIREDNEIGMAVTVSVLILASINLVMDFGLIELGVRNGAPEYMEWYAAMALLVTLVWLYIEVGKLLIQMWMDGALGEHHDQVSAPPIADISRRKP